MLVAKLVEQTLAEDASYRFQGFLKCRCDSGCSVPFELRLLLARDPRALTAVGRIFVQENRLVFLSPD